MKRFSIFLLVIFIGCKSSNNSTELEENQGCMDESAYNYNVDATVDDGSCAYSADSPIIWNVYYETSTPIGGFQFNVEGVSVTAAGSGAASEYGFSVSASSTTVLGFSFSGAVIPGGSGVLVQIEFEGDINTACITDLTLSDSNGNALNAEIISCNTIKY